MFINYNFKYKILRRLIERRNRKASKMEVNFLKTLDHLQTKHYEKFKALLSLESNIEAFKVNGTIFITDEENILTIEIWSNQVKFLNTSYFGDNVLHTEVRFPDTVAPFLDYLLDKHLYRKLKTALDKRKKILQKLSK